MKYCFVFVLAFQTALSVFENINKSDKLKWKNVTKFNCKRINCPLVEKPICVRIRNKKIGSKTKDIYIILLNKCEMKYMKCYQDYQAIVVLMKNCEHYSKLLEHSGKIRPKREISQGIVPAKTKPYRTKGILGELSIFAPSYDIKRYDENRDTPKVEEITSEPDLEDSNKKDKNGKVAKRAQSEISNEENEKENIISDKNESNTNTESIVDFVTTEKENQNFTELEAMTPELSSKESNQRDGEEEKNEPASSIEESAKENIDDNEASNSNFKSATDSLNHDIQAETYKPETDREEPPDIQSDTKKSSVIDQKPEAHFENTSDDKDGKIEEGNDQNDKLDSGDIDVINDRSKYMKSTTTPKYAENIKYDVDYDLNNANEGVDFIEYTKNCPTICPAAEVMVCGRCRDGIYRTFMSVCHLRMFNCKHPDEKAELVTRYPCILSAPYLNEAPLPKGRISEPGDRDLVLQFIRCREKTQKGFEEINIDDPRCNVKIEN